MTKPIVKRRKPVKASGSGERLHGAIARTLGVAIVSGVYKPGEVLDNEIHSSEQLHVSRTAYREAVRMLAAKGLVESRPKTGTRVSDQKRWSLLDPDVLAWFFESGEPSPSFLRDIFELRMVVEPAAAALAAERRTPDDLSRMRRALQEMERHGLAVEDGQVADRHFHDAVIEATYNAPLITLASGIGAAVRWTTIFKQRRRKLPRDPLPDHWRVFDAIAAGGPDAARDAMRDLIALAQEDTRFGLER
ncbi:FadR/GntR family transcriptional regulator [Phenylobacterium montanum]|uniref:FadR family transcriptional regulator n=1 Tax=Phenylobacterium montanum TaxID=2823693 RepID=A0A975G640_9CAUL|nr:FadR/GntR family transcriptional regulator [Caulobacter sp. S6]QUD90746.1 FadR family transcriptional regulator [Caulobacter sp. S6]